MHSPSLQDWTAFKGRQAREQSVPLDQETFSGDTAIRCKYTTTEVSGDFRYHGLKVSSFLSCYLRLMHQLHLLTRLKVHGKTAEISIIMRLSGR
jgi:hypothetical protein